MQIDKAAVIQLERMRFHDEVSFDASDFIPLKKCAEEKSRASEPGWWSKDPPYSSHRQNLMGQPLFSLFCDPYAFPDFAVRALENTLRFFGLS